MVRTKFMIRKIDSKMPEVESIRRYDRAHDDELTIVHLECEFDFERESHLKFRRDFFEDLEVFEDFEVEEV